MEDVLIALDFLFKKTSEKQNINIEDDRKFHGLSEYHITFYKDNDFNANIVEIHIAVFSRRRYLI